jgi:N-acetylglucosaminyldiphosphoundecaprenol N-acetyl-beta-D-mannosaminyltransferase
VHLLWTLAKFIIQISRDFLPRMNLTNRKRAMVLSAPIDVIGWEQALNRISVWGGKRESRYVCICNVHSVVTASRDAGFRGVIDASDMATPDGAPVAWMLRRLGFFAQPRINGPDLMWRYCEQAGASGEAVYFYGSTDDTLSRLRTRFLATFPGLRIAGTESPPFRPLGETEDAETVERINAFGAVMRGMLNHRRNASMEAMNGLMQQAKLAACGFGTATNFIATAYLIADKRTDLPVPCFARRHAPAAS